MKARRRGTQKPPGLYVHSSPPTVLPPHPSVVRQWLRGGEVDKLESVVIQGQGHKLLGEYASDLKVRAFLKTIPAYLARIDMVHEAAAKGNLTDLRTLLKHNTDQNFPRKKLASLALSKDHSGTGLLHKAVYREDREMVRWLVDNYPQTVSVRDREGRTPLHYCGRCRDPDWMWTTLRQAGADSALLDLQGHSPSYYMDHPQEAKLPTTPQTMPGGRFTSGGNGLVVKPANIRIWIHDRDLGRLREVIWEGYGDKLRNETSQNPSVKQFLAGVPYVMGTIKDVHTAAINNDLILLRKRTEDPVPREIILAKDTNGLTPLHKAAGLGHEDVVRAVLSICPEALTRTDREGRTALHYAAAARGSGATYDILLEHGADESSLDKRGKTPNNYLQNTKEIDQKLLTVIPDAPRAGNTSPPFWDWSQLWGEGERERRGGKLPPPPALSNNGDSAFEDMGQEDSSDKQSPETAEIPIDGGKEIPRPGTYDLDADEGVEEEEGEEEKEKGYNADSDEQEGHYEAEYAEVDPDYELTNEPDLPQDETKEQAEHLPSALQEEVEDRTEDDVKDTSDEKIGNPNLEAAIDQDERVQKVVTTGSMEELAALVLSGEGEALAKHRSANPDVQMFIDNIPIYLRKIEKVHTAARQGNLRELQSALDRRKFSVARENVSPLRLTPLHVAVLYGRTSVVRFLGSRFPETLHAQDTKGRSPLHYAATLPDSGHYFDLLAALGGDKNLKDFDGKTPEYYLENKDHVTYEQLRTEFEGKEAKDLKIDFEATEVSDKGLSGRAVVSATTTPAFPVFGADDGQYLADSLGQPLIKGLTEVASKRPPDPIKYLANYLYTYEDDPTNQVNGQPKILEQTFTVEEDHQLTATPPLPVEARVKEAGAELGNDEDGRDQARKTPEPLTSAFKPTQRDEFGQTILHFAMARTHGRNAVFQLLQEIDCNIAFRDELYRTPRDVALQVNIAENAEAIDKYVVSLAATGQLDKLRELLDEGYDHILGARDEAATITEVATERNHTSILTFLDSINSFEDKRERLHRAVRLASDSQVQEMLRGNPGLALAKNQYCRCSLHIAVLNQHDSIVKHIAQRYPQTLVVGDNLMRTALHYAMGVDRVEILSKILIQAGATRVIKDLKGRQPSYYFMNKSEIQKLQDEEDMLRV